MELTLGHLVLRGGRRFNSLEFGDLEERTERERDNLLLTAPPESKS
jgi:hypothetical protein